MLTLAKSLTTCHPKWRILFQTCDDGLNLSCLICAPSFKRSKRKMKWIAAVRKRYAIVIKTKLSWLICAMGKSPYELSLWAETQRFLGSLNWRTASMSTSATSSALNCCTRSSCYSWTKQQSSFSNATSSQLTTTPWIFIWRSRVKTMRSVKTSTARSTSKTAPWWTSSMKSAAFKTDPY